MKYLILKKYLNPPISLEKEGAKPSPNKLFIINPA